jgi:5-keto-L-gluconate epimerase
VNTGRVRGLIGDGEDPLVVRQWYLDCVNRCADVAEPLGVELLVEPVNRYEVNFVNNCSDGLEIIRESARPCLRLMPDTFHMNIEDDSFRNSFLDGKDFISYVHVADSNRMAPGWGHLPFDEIFEALNEIGYDGWLTAEVLPHPDPDHAAEQAVRFLRERVSRQHASQFEV